jgi:hypothetical protein
MLLAAGGTPGAAELIPAVIDLVHKVTRATLN